MAEKLMRAGQFVQSQDQKQQQQNQPPQPTPLAPVAPGNHVTLSPSTAAIVNALISHPAIRTQLAARLLGVG